MSVFDEANQATPDQSQTESQPASAAPASEDLSARLSTYEEQVSKLSKSKEHADAHIQKLEEQIRQQAEDLQKFSNTQTSMEDIKQELNNLRTPHQDTPAGLGEEDVNRILSEREARSRAEANIKKVDEQLSSAYGDKAKEMMNQRAQALGLSTERMRELAAESPEAFLSLVGVQKQAQSSVNLQSSTINTAAGFNQNSEETTREHYNKMRKENPSQYYTGKVQNEIFELVKAGKMKL